MTRAERLLKAFQTTHPKESADLDSSGDAWLEGMFDLEKVLAEYERAEVPLLFHPEIARSVLTGYVDRLGVAFAWSDTPQGEEFWRLQHVAGKLTEEGRAILAAWLGDEV